LYSLVIVLHSLLRWAIVFIGIAAVVRALVGWFGNKHWTPGDERTGRSFAIAMDVQFLLGLLLYLGLSPVTTGAFRNMGGAMQNSAVRFFVAEHPVMALLALVLAHIGVARARKAATPQGKHKAAAIFFLIALVLVFLAVPWPGSSHGRPLLPF
jgi:hypothetical protein